MELLVIGWDGASQRHIQEYDLPYWDSLNYGGNLVPSELFHRASYISSANAWTTMMTGASFEQHQILGFVYGKYTGHSLAGVIRRGAKTTQLPTFLRRVLVSEVLGRIATDGGRMEKDHIQSTDIPFERVWELLPGSSLVFGLPLTYPVWDTDGILVSGIPAPKPSEATLPLVYPRELEQVVYADDFSGYYVDMNSPVFDDSVSEAAYTDAHLQKSEQIADRYLKLYQDEMDVEPEFGFLMLRSIDDVLHATDNEDDIRRTYERIDSVTAQLVEEIDPKEVLILSDHGMRPTSLLRIDSDLRMDHDTDQGVWGASTNLQLDQHADIVPKILNLFEVESDVPVRKTDYDTEMRAPTDGDAVHKRLKELGYA